MIHQLLVRLGLREPDGQARLQRELSAIDITLAYRNQQILKLYDEIQLLRLNRNEVSMKLDQWAERKPKSFRYATAAE